MSDQTQDQRPDLDEVLTQNAIDVRDQLMSNGASGDIHGPEGAIAYQQALAYPRVLDRYEDEDELVDVEQMEADGRKWIDSEVEENPEAFDPQFTEEAFEAIPDDLKQDGRFMNLLKDRYDGQKNVGTDELTSEVIEEIARDADPRVDVQNDGSEETCFVGQETFQPEKYYSDESREREKGHFVAWNGKLYAVCHEHRREFDDNFKDRLGHWHGGWESRAVANKRAERQRKAIEREQEKESRFNDEFGKLSVEERVEETMKGMN